jgi:HK97 family phage portal protein
MSILSALLGGPAERKVVDVSALSWEALLGTGAASKTGVSVGIADALRVSTVLACCRALGEDLAQLPLKLYRKRARNTVEATDHPVYDLLANGPNDWQTSVEWRSDSMLHATLGLGHFGIVSMTPTREVIEILPVVPEAVTIRQTSTWDVTYEIHTGQGESRVVPRDMMLHVRGPGWNNFSALALVAQAREAIGLAIATEETQSRMHSNGARPVGFLTTDKELGKDARERLKALWADRFAGLGNAWKTPVLDNGLKFQAAGLSGVDAQHLETRKHQVEEIARMLGVFPQRIGYSDKTSTYASAEQFFIAHVIYSVMPWVRRWEQALSRDLLSKRERAAGLFPKFNVNALLRGDSKSRSEFYRAALGTSSSPGWMSPNEVRELEELDPMDGLDDVTLPAAPVPATDPAAGMNGSGSGTDMPADGSSADSAVPAAAA